MVSRVVIKRWLQRLLTGGWWAGGGLWVVGALWRRQGCASVCEAADVLICAAVSGRVTVA